MPRSVPRVVRRGDVFYFRMAVPKQWVSTVGKREIKLSLRTCDPTKSRLWGRSLSNAMDVLFDGLQHMPSVSPQVIKERIRISFQQLLNKSLEHSYLLPTDPGFDISGEVEYLQRRVKQLRKELINQSFSQSVRDEAKALLASAGQPGANFDALQHACNAIVRAKMEDARILAARLSGDFAATTPVDPLFANMEPTGLPPVPGDDPEPVQGQPTFGAIAKEFFASKSKHDWVAKTAADVKRVLALATSVIDANKVMRAVDVNDVKAVRDALANVPPNYVKSAASKDFTVEQAIAANKSGATLSRKTQDKYFTMFRQLLIWAVAEGYTEKMPGSGVKVAGVGKTNPAERRNPYSMDQLKAIFSSPLFTGHRSEKCRHEPGKMLSRDGKFWLPLIALYSGLRMGEIVQLLVSDVKQEGGNWFFDVNNGEDGEKRLKTATSKRRVPIHPVLLTAGLLGHRAGKKASERMFPDIEKGNDGYYSHNLSKWYGRYSRKVGFHTSKTAFHSFRHNFKDALQSAEVPEYISRALIGHLDKSVHAQYGTGPTLKALKAAVDKFEYDVDLNMTKKTAH